MLNSSLSMQRDLEQDNGHSSDLDQRKSGTLLVKTVHKGNGTELQSKWCWHLQKAHTQSSDPRVHCPEECLKAKVVENCRYFIAAIWEWLKLFFRTVFSVNQLSLYGAVPEMCEECESCHDRTGRLVVEGQSKPLFVPSVMKTNILLTDDLAQEEDLLQRYRERIEKLSQQDRLSKCCTDAGFLTTVEVGQWYFMTKDAEEVSQFTDSVACREYIFPRDESLSEPKGWIRGNTMIGPVLEVTTCCVQGKYGVEIRIESVNKDNSHSWVRISHGLNKLVADLIDNEQETSEMQIDNIALKSNACAFASRSKTTRNHTDVLLPAHPQQRYLLVKELGLILHHKNIRSPNNQYERNWSFFFVMVVYLEKKMERLNSGDWRIKYLRNDFVHSRHWSDEKWKSTMARGGGNKKIFQYCIVSPGEILYLRALQGHSGRILIDSSLQDNVLIPDDFFKYIYHVGWAINLHSIINSGLTPGGQKLSERSFCLWIRWIKNTKILRRLTWKHRVLHGTCMQHGRNIKTRVLGSTSTCSKERIKVLSNAIERHHLSEYNTLPACCIPKVVRMETGEVIYEKVYASPWPPPKISLKHDWMTDFGSEVARQAEVNQPTQPNTNPDHDRTGRPVVKFENEEFWSQKRKLWEKRRGQESRDETAWTQKSGRLFAMGIQRAVF